MFLAEPAIIYVTVNLIHMSRCRIVPKSFSKCLDLTDQIPGFIEGIPTDAVNKRNAIDETDRYLGTKFRSRTGLTPFDRTHMGLADDAIVDTIFMLVIHPLLLAIDFVNNQQIFILTGTELR